MKKLITLALVAGLAFTAACKKKEEPKPTPGVAKPGPAAGTTTPAPTATTAQPAAGTDGKPGADEPSGGPIDAQSVINAQFAAFNEGNLERAAAFVTEDYEDRNAASPDTAVKGREGIIKVWQGLKSAFSDLRVAAKRIFDAGGIWVVQGVAHGTHTGELHGIKATGEKVGWEFLRYLQIENGKMKRSVVYMPSLVIYRQIKAIPSRGEKTPPIPAWPDKAEVITGEGPQANVDAYVAVHKAMNENKWEGVAAGAKPDMTLYNTANGRTIKGVDEQKKMFEGMKKAFPDSAFADEVVIGVGNWVIARTIMSGTHKGDMGPIKATNKPIAVHGADVVKMEGGKAVHLEAYRDPVEMMSQLGLFALGVPGGAAPMKNEKEAPAEDDE